MLKIRRLINCKTSSCHWPVLTWPQVAGFQVATGEANQFRFVGAIRRWINDTCTLSDTNKLICCFYRLKHTVNTNRYHQRFNNHPNSSLIESQIEDRVKRSESHVDQALNDLIKGALRDFLDNDHVRLLANNPTSLAPLDLELTPVSDTDLAEIKTRWDEIRLGRGQKWAFVGGGDGRTLNHIARRHPEAQVRAIELETDLELRMEALQGYPNLRGRPENVTYSVMGPLSRIYESSMGLRHLSLDPSIIKPAEFSWFEKRQYQKDYLEAIERRAIRALGKRENQVASVIFPHKPKVALRCTPHEQIVRMSRLSVAAEVLTAGGLGVLVTESPATLVQALDFLQSGRKGWHLSSVLYSQNPLSGAELREMGIETVPYFTRELVPGLLRQGDEEQIAGSFNWGWMALFEVTR